MPIDKAPIELPAGMIVSLTAASISCSSTENEERCVAAIVFFLPQAVIQKRQGR